MILGEIHPDKIIILLTELCTRSDRDIGLDAAELDKLKMSTFSGGSRRRDSCRPPKDVPSSRDSD